MQNILVSSRNQQLIVAHALTAVALYASGYSGNSTIYIVSSLSWVVLVIYTVAVNPQNSIRLSTVAFSFLVFRYLPIAKYRQPLFDDPWSELRTAKFFFDADEVLALPLFPNDHLTVYSRWPIVHSLSITLTHLTGVQLVGIFTYLGPIIALPSLFFVFLLTRDLLDDSRKAAISALVFSTFSITMFWQLQLVRQNLALTMLCGGLYSYVRARKLRNQPLLVLSLFFFAVLPLVHHLTSLAAVACLALAYLVEKFYWKANPSATFVAVVSSVTLLTWTFLQADVIVPSLFERAFNLIYFLGEGRLGKIQSRLFAHFDVYDLLNIVRILYFASATFIGLFEALRHKFKFGGLLTGFFVGSGIPLALALVTSGIDERFALLLTIPAVILVSHVRLTNKGLLAMALIILILPTPFKLFETFNAAPSYVFDARSSVDFSFGEFSKYRGSDTFALAQWNAEFNIHRKVLVDRYNGEILQQYYDPALIYLIAPYALDEVVYHPKVNLLVFFNRYYAAGRYVGPVVDDLQQLISHADMIYNDGSQLGYFVGS